jgi:hypothetical protein
MRARAAMTALFLLALPALAHAQPASCVAPPLEPALRPPTEERPNWETYNDAVNAQKKWSAPRMKYGACRRAEIDALGKRVNAVGAEINALVDEVAAIERRLRTAREMRLTAFRAYGARRNRAPDEWPVAAAPSASGTQMPPCPAPSTTPAPTFPDGATANANAMRRADERFQEWAAPLDTYIGCRKLERQVMAAQHQALSDELATAQAGFASYRAAFNTSVARYQSALDAYAARIPKR